MSSSVARNLLCPLAQQDLAPLLFQTHKHTLLEKDGWKKSMMLDRSHEHQSQGRRLTSQKSMTGYQKAQGTLSTKIAKPAHCLRQGRSRPSCAGTRAPQEPRRTTNKRNEETMLRLRYYALRKKLHEDNEDQDARVTQETRTKDRLSGRFANSH